MHITYIRWSMTIVEMAGLTVVTDPVCRMAGLFAFSPRTYTLDDLLVARPAVVLVSHRHQDHWDPWTMARLPRDIALLVRPGGIAAAARRLGYANVRELAPGSAEESAQVQGLAVTAVPAVHPGGEVGFVLQGDKTVYFAGDTSFDAGLFAAIGRRFAPDVALLPIGGLRFLGGQGQMTPTQAAEAIRLLGARAVVGIHWGGAPNVPPFLEMRGTPGRLETALAQAQLPGVRVCCREPLHREEVL